jgi:hypothetical protein
VTQVSGGFADPNRHGIMGNMSVVTARVNYQPNLVQEFTLSTAERGKLAVQIQLTEPDRTARFASDDFKAFGFGGSVAFDGTTGTQPKSGTFAFDLTDIAASYGDVKYRVQVNNGGHFTTTLSGVALVDRLKSNLRTATTDPTATIGENDGKGQSVRYKYQDSSRVPRLSVTPASSIGFGSAALGSAVERPLTLTNTGSGNLYLTSLRFSSPLFRALNYYPQFDTFQIAPGQSLGMTLEFAPGATQSETATVSVRNTSSNSASPSLALSGSGTSNNDSAPLQVFITQQNDPLDIDRAPRRDQEPHRERGAPERLPRALLHVRDRRRFQLARLGHVVHDARAHRLPRRLGARADRRRTLVQLRGRFLVPGERYGSGGRVLHLPRQFAPRGLLLVSRRDGRLVAISAARRPRGGGGHSTNRDECLRIRRSR